MYLAKNLKYLRLKSGFSQDYIAEKLGYKSYTTIQKWESGTTEPPLVALSSLAKLYGYTLHELYTTDLTGNGESENFKTVPVIGTIAAGTPLLATENITDRYIIDQRIQADFCLEVKGESMIEAGIKDGDFVFIKKQSCVDNGDIAVILIDEEATLKRFYRQDGVIILKPENSKFQPQIYKEKDFKQVIVLGKAVMVQSKL